MGSRAAEPASSAGVCRDPSEAERRALTALMLSVLPVDGATGRPVDLAPGEPLPDGLIPPKRPDLYGAAQWSTGMFCRCFEERCQGAETKPEVPTAPEP